MLCAHFDHISEPSENPQKCVAFLCSSPHLATTLRKRKAHKQNLAAYLCASCERAVKRCINVGKNSKKVCDFALLTTRQIGSCLSVLVLRYYSPKQLFSNYISTVFSVSGNRFFFRIIYGIKTITIRPHYQLVITSFTK